MPSDLAGASFGLASAASWGAGDFTGGLASRRSPVLGVLAFGQAAGVSAIAAVALLTREPTPPVASLAWAVAAGAAGAVGLAALYRGLAVGQMAVVAPVSAVLSAAIPVGVGALLEGVPAPARLLGFAFALVGIWLVAGAGGREPGRGTAGLGLALVAGVGFGGFLVLMDRGARGGTFWPLVAARATSLGLALAAALASRRPWVPPGRALPLVLSSGVLDAGGNAFFVLSTQAGRMDVAAVTSSMYPASTVALAALVLRERMSRRQATGVAAVLVAIALIAG